jgi:hypothetical protein
MLQRHTDSDNTLQRAEKSLVLTGWRTSKSGKSGPNKQTAEEVSSLLMESRKVKLGGALLMKAIYLSMLAVSSTTEDGPTFQGARALKGLWSTVRTMILT